MSNPYNSEQCTVDVAQRSKLEFCAEIKDWFDKPFKNPPENALKRLHAMGLDDFMYFSQLLIAIKQKLAYLESIDFLNKSIESLCELRSNLSSSDDSYDSRKTWLTMGIAHKQDIASGELVDVTFWSLPEENSADTRTIFGTQPEEVGAYEPSPAVQKDLEQFYSTNINDLIHYGRKTD